MAASSSPEKTSAQATQTISWIALADQKANSILAQIRGTKYPRFPSPAQLLHHPKSGSWLGKRYLIECAVIALFIGSVLHAIIMTVAWLITNEQAMPWRLCGLPGFVVPYLLTFLGVLLIRHRNLWRDEVLGALEAEYRQATDRPTSWKLKETLGQHLKRLDTAALEGWKAALSSGVAQNELADEPQQIVMDGLQAFRDPANAPPSTVTVDELCDRLGQAIEATQSLKRKTKTAIDAIDGIVRVYSDTCDEKTRGTLSQEIDAGVMQIITAIDDRVAQNKALDSLSTTIYARATLTGAGLKPASK